MQDKVYVDDGYEDYGWLARNYGGAPDECNIHWPTKYDANGNCPECKEEPK